jgi:hypothetical protein
MRTRLFTLLVLALPLLAAPLSTEERRTLLTQLEKSSAVVLEALNGVSETQWNFKPAPERWSIAECAEHIVTADQAMFTFGSQQLLKMNPPAGAVKRDDDAILKTTTDRSTKVKTAEFLEPKGKYADKTAVIDAFQKGRARIAEYVKSTQDDLRAHGFQGPTGYVDAYQFLLTLSAHGERHAQQIAEVKADPGYPKK